MSFPHCTRVVKVVSRDPPRGGSGLPPCPLCGEEQFIMWSEDHEPELVCSSCTTFLVAIGVL